MDEGKWILWGLNLPVKTRAFPKPVGMWELIRCLKITVVSSHSKTQEFQQPRLLFTLRLNQVSMRVKTVKTRVNFHDIHGNEKKIFANDAN